MDLNKLKVLELRKELQVRGLDTKGNKPVLVERLREAIEKEQGENEESENEEEITSSEENSLMYTTADGENAVVDAEASSEPEVAKERPFSVITDALDTSVEPVQAVDENSVSVEETSITEPTVAATIVPPEPAVVSADVAVPVPAEIPSEPSVEQAIDYSSAVESSDQPPKQTEAVIAEESSPQSSPVSQPQPQPEEPPPQPQPTEEPSFEDSSSVDAYADDSQPLPEREAEKMDFEDSNAMQSFATHADSAAYAHNNIYSSERFESYSQADVNNVEETSQSLSSDVPASEDDSRGPTAEAGESNDVSKSEFDETMESQDGESAKLEESMDTQNDEVGAEPKNDHDSAGGNLDNKEEPSWGEEVDAANSVSQPAVPSESVKEGEAVAEEPKKRVRRSRFDQPDSGHEEKQSKFDQPEDRKRKHSPSPNSWSNNYEAPPKIAKQDDEPPFDENAVILSWYDSDLNLNIDKENFTSAVPSHDQGFAYMWAGVRSTYGFKSGKIYFDVKLLEKSSATISEEFEIFSFRVGYSAEESSLQLGEVPFSYGYDSSGKKCTDNNFEDYGEAYNPEDVVGCLLDFESDEENVQISFVLNGTKQEVAFQIPKESLGEKALFPHVLSKNIKFEVNFGERSEPWIADEAFKEGFEWASKIPEESRVRGPKKPEEKKDCEMVLICGLPCSGKTTWAQKHAEENPEKHYNVIGVVPVLEKMKIQSEDILEHYKDNPDVLAERCTRCVNSLIETASSRWRNYILDQVNVYSTVQRRKARAFDGFKRLAVVTIPSESDYDEYVKKLEENPIRDTASSVLELKSNFRLPEEGDTFDSVLFVGVDKEEAEEIVRKYNKEGRDARPSRDDRSYNRYGGGRDMERGSYGRPPYRSRFGGSDRGPPPPMARGGWGGPRGGMDRMPPSGGFRDRRGWRDRSPDNDRDGFRSRYQPHGGGGRFGGGGRGMMDGSRSWGGGSRDRDRMGPPPRMGGAGPNPLLGPMMGGKPGGGPMGYGERKSRFDEPKRRGDHDDFERPGRLPMSGDDGSGGEEGDRKRRSRFSDSRGPGGGGGGGFRGGRGGNDRGPGGFGGGAGGGGRGGRPGQFAPRGPPDAAPGGFGRNRDDGNFYGGGNRGGGGPPRRDGRDNKPPMGQRPGMNRFGEKNDASGKNDATPGMNPQAGWGMYGQAGWNPAAASQYQNWAQYQSATGYTPQQLQQYWSQMQQQQQQQASAQSKAGQPGGKSGAQSGNAGTAATSQAAGSQPQAGAAAGYSTQGQGAAAGYGAQGYDATAYAQYCAQYSQYYSQLAAQGWTQNADGSYSYPQNAWAQYGYNAAAGAGNSSNGVPSTSAPPPSTNASSTTSSSLNQKSGPVMTKSSK